jgi:hypothetical protein
VKKQRPYVLDLGTVIRIIATELGRASRPLSLSDMVPGIMRHSSVGDIPRMARILGLDPDTKEGEREGAKALLVEGITEMNRTRQQVAEIEGGYRLAVPFDSLRWGTTPVYPLIDEGDDFPGYVVVNDQVEKVEDDE